MSPGIPANAALPWMTPVSWLYLFIPAALLCSLFCARLGVERGQKLRGGSLPSTLFFCAWLFALEWIGGPGRRFPAESSAFGLLLLAVFAVLRADPPASAATGLGWTLAAGVLGALSVGSRVDAVGSVGGLGLYVWWAAGWRRAFGFALAAVIAAGVILACTATGRGPVVRAPFLYLLLFLVAASLGHGLWRWMPPDPPPVYGPELPGTLPMASAHRVIGGLLFLTLMGLPAAAGGGWGFVAWPSGVAASLILTGYLARPGKISPAAPAPSPAATP